MRSLSALIPLAWCVLGYFFLDRGESACSIVTSMAAITAACWGPARERDPDDRGPRQRR